MNFYFFNAVLKLTAGNSISRVPALLSMPIIAIYLPVAEIGKYGLIISIINAIVPFVSFKLGLTLPSVISKNTKNYLYNFIVKTIVVATAITVTLIYIYFSIFDIHQVQKTEYLIAITVGTISFALFELYECRLIDQQNYVSLAKSKISLNSFVEITKILISLKLSMGPLLIIPNVIKSIVAVKSMRPVKKSARQQKWLKLFLLKNKSTILYRAPSQTISAFFVLAPVFYISKTYGQTNLGYFYLASATLILPITIFSQAAVRVLLANKLRNREALYISYTKSSMIFVFSSVMPLLLFIFLESFSSEIVNLKWLNAINITLILLPVLPFQITAQFNLLSNTVNNTEHKALLLHTTKLLLCITFLLINSQIGNTNFFDFIIRLSIFNGFVYFALILVNRHA